jgi:hypothetical protein
MCLFISLVISILIMNLFISLQYHSNVTVIDLIIISFKFLVSLINELFLIFVYIIMILKGIFNQLIKYFLMLIFHFLFINL